jgi:soluble lytic murein transglycosylase
MKKKDEAIAWYRKGARHVTSFYGQLASEKLEDARNWALPADPKPTKADITRFENRPLTVVVRNLMQIGMYDTLRPFIINLHDVAETPGERWLAGQLAEQAGRAEIGVVVSKRADREHVSLISAGFPIPALRYVEAPEKALVLSVIRQESAFQDEAVSTAGARGLMQLMPDTAKRVAKMLKIAAFSNDKLTADPAFNVRLGSAYLTHVLEDFDGSYVLALAGYNAGPGRSRRWMRENGDPRAPDVDPIDWIEMIPFSETRNYVQRVLENVQVYRRRLGVGSPHSLERDLRR